MSDIDYEQLQQEERMWPWINDPSEEPGIMSGTMRRTSDAIC